MKKAIQKIGKTLNIKGFVSGNGKKDTDLKSNSTLYFQIGLIICLLGTYLALESKTEVKSKRLIFQDARMVEEWDYTESNFQVYKEPELEVTSAGRKEPVVISDVITVTDNDAKNAKEDVDFITQEEQQFKGPVTKGVPTSAPELVVEKPEEPVSILAVQFVPVYPGCESETTNLGRRQCMSDKLREHIRKQFDGDIGADLGLNGRQKIDVLFKINKQGEVVILKTRAPRRELEKEAQRVVSKVPTMQPGKNGDSVVEVLYSLPIVFDVQD